MPSDYDDRNGICSANTWRDVITDTNSSSWKVLERLKADICGEMLR